MGLAVTSAAETSLSFDEYASRKTLHRLERRGFMADVREHHGTFNFRSEFEWYQLLREYRSRDRTRRS